MTRDYEKLQKNVLYPNKLEIIILMRNVIQTNKSNIQKYRFPNLEKKEPSLESTNDQFPVLFSLH